MRRILAAVVVLSFAVRVAAADPVYVADGPAPKLAVPLVWRFGEQLSPGAWFPEERYVANELRLRIAESQVEYLTTRAAKECFDGVTADTRARLTGSRAFWWGLAGGLVAGLAAGYAIGRATR